MWASTGSTEPNSCGRDSEISSRSEGTPSPIPTPPSASAWTPHGTNSVRKAVTDPRRSATRTTPSNHKQRKWPATQARSKCMLKKSSVGTLKFYGTRHAAERGDPDLKRCQLDEYRETP